MKRYCEKEKIIYIYKYKESCIDNEEAATWLFTIANAMKLKDSCSLEGKLWQNLRQYIKNQRCHFAEKVM